MTRRKRKESGGRDMVCLPGLGGKCVACGAISKDWCTEEDE